MGGNKERTNTCRLSAEIADLEAKVGVLDKARKTGEAATKVEEAPKKKSWW